jgi:periplasmic divalent cation tolerance protein
MENAIHINIVLVTIDKIEKAKEIAKALLENRLIACCNIIPNVTSLYTWNGDVVEDSECLMIIKTLRHHLEDVEELITEMHSYEVPEIISYHMGCSSKSYLDWLVNSVRDHE